VKHHDLCLDRAGRDRNWNRDHSRPPRIAQEKHGLTSRATGQAKRSEIGEKFVTSPEPAWAEGETVIPEKEGARDEKCIDWRADGEGRNDGSWEELVVAAEGGHRTRVADDDKLSTEEEITSRTAWEEKSVIGEIVEENPRLVVWDAEPAGTAEGSGVMGEAHAVRARAVRFSRGGHIGQNHDRRD